MYWNKFCKQIDSEWDVLLELIKRMIGVDKPLKGVDKPEKQPDLLTIITNVQLNTMGKKHEHALACKDYSLKNTASRTNIPPSQALL